VVVTGASSGVGRATAHAFASLGCRVVLVARDLPGLDDVRREVAARGGEGVVVVADVADVGDVRRVADVASDHGPVDVWVNGAAVLVAGLLGTESVDELDRIIDTNIRGTALASREALRLFGLQEHGVLVNVSSLLGVVPNPLVPLYVMSKFAVRGLSLALHHATAGTPGVHVCTVLPAAIDTPMFDRSANHTGRRLRAIAPAVAPERVAATIVSCARRPRREAVAGGMGHLLWVAHRVAPATAEWVVARYAAAVLVDPATPADETRGALFTPPAQTRLDGGYRLGRLRRRAGRRLGLETARLATRRW
jgi:short-subunit dehydrogenase